MSVEGQFLFLDRDGVINRRLPGAYIQKWNAFDFLPGALSAIALFSNYFQRIFIVTNQQGIGKGLMTEQELSQIHQLMKDAIQQAGGRVDGVYYCPALATDPHNCRKPHPAMAEWAKRDFPEVDFAKSIMIGDSLSDIQFGHALGMRTVLVTSKEEEKEQLLQAKANGLPIDWEVEGLAEFAAKYGV